MNRSHLIDWSHACRAYMTVSTQLTAVAIVTMSSALSAPFSEQLGRKLPLHNNEGIGEQV